MNSLPKFLFLIFALSFSAFAMAQTVGVVLSGGGATAAAHLGFLKALEEENIPIDYITGTSMGAVIGGFYAAGYSVEEIEQILLSEEFLQMTENQVAEDLRYYFKTPEDNAGMGTIKFRKGQWITSTLPTNIGNPMQLNFNLMEYFSPASGAANYNFDQLYIPFRCNAADVENKQQVVFRSGNLATAIRASMTYPFFVEPIRVDGKLLFDGGLYNNFPSDILYADFKPDVIIGCNVSENFDPPLEDDFFSQLASMVTTQTNFDRIIENMVIVKPELDVETFDFADMKKATQTGLMATRYNIDDIKALVTRQVTREERDAGREAFKSKQTPLVFNEISVSGLDKAQKSYVNRIISRKQDSLELDQLKMRYFRAFADDKIKSIFPSATLDTQSQSYKLHLNVKKEKDLFLEVGGIYSSRPINTGYIGLKYHLFGKTGSTLYANSYFGKFYGSVSAGARIDFAGVVPFSIEPNLTFNRWDYFTSFATFFEDVQPSFIVVNERFGGLRMRVPVRNKGKIEASGNYARINDDYYQTTQFSRVDTADRTSLNVGVFDLIYDRNTLNRKQFASKGTRFQLKVKYLVGEEQTIPGSTSISKDTTYTDRDWLVAKLSYENYFQRLGPLRLGFLLEGVASTQPFMRNHVSTLISAPAFQPIPESRTFFINAHRGHNYVSGGIRLVGELSKSLEVRAEGYVFNPFGRIETDDFGETIYKWENTQYYIASSSLVFHSPLGPLAFQVNYYDQKEKPWSVVLNFGYIIFNRSVRNI